MCYIISNEILNIVQNQIHLPDLPESIILEFLGYKFRCGKFIYQLPQNIEIYEELLERPKIKDDLSISLDINYKKYHRDMVVKTLEIKFSPNDRNKYKKKICYYIIDFDHSRHKFIPYTKW